MICPHCQKTIREEDRYLMSRDPDGDYVWSPTARIVSGYLIFFCLLVGAFALITHP